MKLIVTPRLIVRDFTPEDADELYEYLSDPEVTKFEPYDPFDHDKAIFEARARAMNPMFKAVCLKDDSVPEQYRAPGVYDCDVQHWGRLIGNLFFCPDAFSSYELGYVFNRNFWKHGYACESAKALMNHAFNTGTHRIFAHCNPDNPNSWRLMERLGMRREGRMIRNAALKNNANGQPIYWDTYIYGILSDEWKGLDK